ncbi:MAG: VCBS repeat-containing protein [Saprospiraceae bacterium]|nr:VCBS repeat-containing protein [Saprospiraceae bacterium]
MYKGNTRLLLLLFLCFGLQVGWAQSNWSPNLSHKTFFSGIPLATADINGDGLDDLIVLDQTKHLWIGIQYGAAEFLWKSLDYHNTFPAWSVNVADIDRNGYNDIVISGERSQVHILYQESNGFERSLVDDTYMFSQAAVVYDVNQDGWLDYTLCDDNEINRIYLNDGVGNLRLDTAFISMGFADPALDAGNYGCIWTDLENDGDPDLYISKCRPGVEDTLDPRRLNQLWVHDQGQWTSAAELYGLDVGDQSWVSLFEDFDNDGLKDCFVVNHYTPCRLFRQKSDRQFEEITATSGFTSAAIIIQAIPADFDNDGDLDLLVTGNASELWLNDGNMHFSKKHTLLQDANFSSCAYGDFNSDGFMDVCVSHADLLNTPNNQKDQLWLNPGNANHFVKFTLKGKVSNPNGVGTRVVVYTDGRMQSRELHAGEAFGVQNSLNVHFGLDAFEKIDSVIFYWPSGIIDKHFSFAADLQYLVEEGRCLTEMGVPKQAYQVVYFCDQIDTVINTSDQLRDLVWNTGIRSDSLNIKGEGVYYYQGYNAANCLVTSRPVSFINNPGQNFMLSHRYDKVLCQGDQLELSVIPNAELIWSDSRKDSVILVKQTGKYFAKVKGLCEDSYTDTLNLVVAETVKPPKIKSDTLLFKRPAFLTSDSDSTYWYKNQTDLVPEFVGKNFETDSIDSDRSFWAENVSSFSYPFVHGGLSQPEYQSSAYHAPFLNAQMIFNVYDDLILDSITLFTDFPGQRTIDLLNDLGERIAKKDVELNNGKNQVYLGFEIPKSEKSYTLTTNLEQNQKLWNENSPRLQRSDKGFYYPFFIQDKVRLLTSSNGDSYYYYFYDWVIRKPGVNCSSERIEIPVIYRPVDASNPGAEHLEFLVYGNAFKITGHEDWKFDWEILSLEAKPFARGQHVANQWIYFPEPVRGIYLIRLRKENGTIIVKWLSL